MGFFVKNYINNRSQYSPDTLSCRGHRRVVMSLLSCLPQKKATHTIGKEVLQVFKARDCLNAARIMHANKDELVIMMTFDPHQATFPGIILSGRLRSDVANNSAPGAMTPM